MIRRLALSALLVTLPALTGCSSTPSDGRLQVVTGFYPLQFLAEQIGGESVSVENLTMPGVEPHDMTLTIRQTAKVIDADVVVYLSGFQAPVDDAVAQSGAEQVVDLATSVDLESSSEDPGEPDPHFWLDPQRMSGAAVSVADALSSADPSHAAEYAANLAALQDQLAQLDQDFSDGLARCERTLIVVSHDAFTYLGDRYHLEVQAIAGLSPDAEPSPKHIADLHDLIADSGITTVFSETLASPAMADALARDLGLRSEVLDPIEGLTSDEPGEDYLSIMRQNLQALQEANGCR